MRISPILIRGMPCNYCRPGFQQSVADKKPSIEDLLSMSIVETRGRFNRDEARLDNIETHCTNMSASIKSLKVQIGQLATELKNQQKGKFPSDIEHNPREQCKVIMLRSRKEVKSSKPREIQGKKFEKKVEVEKEPAKAAPKTNSISFLDNPPVITPPLPFPQRFQKHMMDDKFSKFLEMFKKLHINIPFVEASEKIHDYIKFMKEGMSKKKRLEEFETVNLTEEFSAILQRNLPHKLKDPGSFTIPCTINNYSFDKALCDLGASIKLMPLSVFKSWD